MQYQRNPTLSQSPWKADDKTDMESDESSSEEPAATDTPMDNNSTFPDEKKKRRRRRRRYRSNPKQIVPYRPTGHVFHPSQSRVRPSVPVALQQHWSMMNAALHFRHNPHEHRQRYVAMDCEMVGVGPMGKRSVLARVSLVNWDRHVLLDTFVKVLEPVTDYRTFVSGIRPGDLESSDAMDFGRCRYLVHQLLQGKILVGHGLENDLKVLRLTHPWQWTRDTAKYEPFMRTCAGTRFFGEQYYLRAKKLSELATTHLGISIQGDEHDSIEDARCAMELYKSVHEEWDNAVEWKRQAQSNRRPCYYSDRVRRNEM